jgi:hypothetical protein
MKKKILWKSIVAVLMSAVLVCANLSLNDAKAYEYLACDDGDDPISWSEECSACAVMYINTSSFSAGGASWNRLFEAMDAWNNVEGSTFDFLALPYSSNTVTHGNDVNEVYLSGIDGPGGTLAITHRIYNSCLPLDDADMKEADVEFDVDENWQTGGDWFYNLELDKPFTERIHHPNFKVVALHEFGHALGLSHEDDKLATMNSQYPGGGPMGPGALIAPLADDRAGLRSLYFDLYNIPTKADLVASNYKRTGAGTSDRVNSPVFGSPGGQITFEFTFMNLGMVNSGNFNIGFYLSSDKTITTADNLIGTNFNASVSGGGVVTGSRTLTIPSNLAPGFYWLGVFLDKDAAVSELSESNNGLHLPRLMVIN